MRKWIVIALVSIALAGVFALLANRGPRSVEDIKRQYSKALFGRLWMDTIRNRWSEIMKQPRDWEASRERRLKRVLKCERSLIKAGYWEQRTFVVSNPPTSWVVGRAVERVGDRDRQVTFPIRLDDSHGYVVVRPKPGAERPPEVLGRARSEGTNLVIVVAPKEEMANWEKLVREADK